MAVEINSKNLHKHAVPLLVIAAIMLVVSIISLSQYQPSLARGLEALLGQNESDQTGSLRNISNVGADASQNLKQN